ncbi:hypothetical protein [Terricaulis sp.]|uniref:hypothetical protein n=1 Tax=Terricaulis sp. TaxID=2768686 RepID=UPI003783FAC1
MTFYKFMVGFVLSLAMIVVLTMGAIVFSARDFQFGVQQISDQTNGLISFDALKRAEGEIATINHETEAQRGQLEQVNQQVAALTAQIENARRSAESARIGLVSSISAVEQRAGVQAAADSSTQALNARIATLTGRTGLSTQDQTTVTQAQAQVQALAQREEAADTAAAQLTQVQAQHDLVDSGLTESRARILAWQMTVLRDTDQFDRIANEARALNDLSPWGISAYFAQGHPSLLSTGLVLLMGALGALLYLFPAYLNRPIPVTNAEIFVRLIFGMCAALAFYVLANATVAGFSIADSVAQAGTSSKLNPFTVSLIGIVAGVLSEDIAKWIQDRGRGIFTQGQISAGSTGQGQAPPAADTGGGLVNNEAIR